MKKILSVAALALLALVGSAHAQPQAREIAFVQNCTKGVHVYDKSSGSVTCGQPSMSGAGYVIEMATDMNSNVQCPRGYSLVGNIPSSGNLQHFACVKN